MSSATEITVRWKLGWKEKIWEAQALRVLQVDLIEQIEGMSSFVIIVVTIVDGSWSSRISSESEIAIFLDGRQLVDLALESENVNELIASADDDDGGGLGRKIY